MSGWASRDPSLLVRGVLTPTSGFLCFIFIIGLRGRQDKSSPSMDNKNPYEQQPYITFTGAWEMWNTGSSGWIQIPDFNLDFWISLLLLMLFVRFLFFFLRRNRNCGWNHSCDMICAKRPNDIKTQYKMTWDHFCVTSGLIPGQETENKAKNTNDSHIIK